MTSGTVVTAILLELTASSAFKRIDPNYPYYFSDENEIFTVSQVPTACTNARMTHVLTHTQLVDIDVLCEKYKAPLGLCHPLGDCPIFNSSHLPWWYPPGLIARPEDEGLPIYTLTAADRGGCYKVPSQIGSIRHAVICLGPPTITTTGSPQSPAVASGNDIRPWSSSVIPKVPMTILLAWHS